MKTIFENPEMKSQIMDRKFVIVSINGRYKLETKGSTR